MHAFTASRRAAVATLLALGLAGCRDLALPSPPTSPTRPAFQPASAFAGQLLRITADHLDPDATANTVSFAYASARGIRFEGADLVVRVPADAGDGSITVANREGTSEPSSSAFDYLGFGQPRRGQIVSEAPILHHPRRLHSLYYRTFIESQLYGTRDGNLAGLVGYGTDTRGPDPYVSTSASAPWRSLLVSSLDDAMGTTVTLVDQVGGTWRQAHLDGVHPWRLVAVRGVTQADDLLVSFQYSDVEGRDTLAAWKIDALWSAPPVTTPFIAEQVVTLETPEGPVTVTGLTGPADTGDGRIAAVVSTVGESRLGIGIVDFRGRSDYYFLPPGTEELDARVSDSGFDGLAAAPRGPGLSSALVFALEQGRVGYLDFDFLGVPPIADNVLVLGTYSAAPVTGLVLSAIPGGKAYAIATKPDDDLVLGMDFAGGAIAWGLPTAGARHGVVDHARSSVVYVANDRDNDVLVVNTETGRQIGRLRFDVAPTSVSVGAGAAFTPADPLDPYTTDEVYLVAGNPAAVLVHPLGFGQQASAWRPAWPAALARDPSSRDVWGAAEGAGVADAMPIAQLSGVAPAFATGTTPVGLPSVATHAGGHFVVGHDGGLTAVAGGAVIGTWAPPAQPQFYNLGATPDGELVVAATWDAVDRVQLWDPAQIGATGAPLAEWTAAVTEYVDWAAWLEDGLWAQHTDYSVPSSTVSRLARSGPSLVEAQAVTPVEPFGLVGMFVGTTPNGRALVAWENRAGGGTAMRLFSADPATGFAEIAYVALEGNLVGVAFDASGEHAYVVTQSPDRIVTVD